MRKIFLVALVVLMAGILAGCESLPGDTNIWEMLAPVLVIVAGVIGNAMRGLVKEQKNATRATLYNSIADDMLALIRLNNPNNRLVENTQFYKDELYKALMADAKTSSDVTVNARIAAATVARAHLKESSTFPAVTA